jgi:hypothetical protein
MEFTAQFVASETPTTTGLAAPTVLPTPDVSAGEKPASPKRSLSKEERSADMVARLLARFEDGSIATPIQKTVIRRRSDDPLSDLPMDKWSMLNQIHCVMMGTMDARGSKQWKTVGRHPKKGSSALWITIPTFKTWWEDDLTINGDGTATATKKRVKKQLLTGFKLGPVFRYEDTVAFPGQPEHLQTWDYTPPSLPPLAEFAASLGLNVTYRPHETASRGQLGTYDVTSGVNIDLYTADNQTFFHELAHALHHRVLESRGVKMEAVPVDIAEVVAETAATVISSLYDEDYSGTCLEYLRRFTSDESTETILRVLSKATSDIVEVVAMVLDTNTPTTR